MFRIYDIATNAWSPGARGRSLAAMAVRRCVEQQGRTSWRCGCSADADRQSTTSQPIPGRPESGAAGVFLPAIDGRRICHRRGFGADANSNYDGDDAAGYVDRYLVERAAFSSSSVRISGLLVGTKCMRSAAICWFRATSTRPDAVTSWIRARGRPGVGCFTAEPARSGAAGELGRRQLDRPCRRRDLVDGGINGNTFTFLNEHLYRGDTGAPHHHHRRHRARRRRLRALRRRRLRLGVGDPGAGAGRRLRPGDDVERHVRVCGRWLSFTAPSYTNALTVSIRSRIRGRRWRR